MDPTSKAEELGFRLPPAYFHVQELGLTNLKPWYFIESSAIRANYSQINERFAERHVLPFARRGDCDDVACFVLEEDARSRSEVVVIHDYAAKGMEVVNRMPNFWDWFRSAVEDMIQWSELPIEP